MVELAVAQFVQRQFMFVCAIATVQCNFRLAARLQEFELLFGTTTVFMKLC